MKKNLVYLITLLFTFSIYAQDVGRTIAHVQGLKGEVKEIWPDGTVLKVEKSSSIKEGSVIKTSEKSFVRLKFIDNSLMNLGPKGEVKIEKFSKDEAGIINVVKGKIRSQVTKDYLDMDQEKSKLFIKSKSAVMGVRGTDFIFTTNAKNNSSTAILFNGSIAFNKVSSNVNNKNLEKLVSSGRFIQPGQFSMTSQGKKPTVPAKLSSKQLNSLYKNENFEKSDRKKKVRAKKSKIPDGLDGSIVSSSSESLNKSLQEVSGIEVAAVRLTDKDIAESKGYVKGDDFKPVDGTIVHLDSGVLIPIPNDAEFVPNTGEWVSTTNGGVDETGSYIPPVGYAMSDDGKLLKETISVELQKENKVVEVVLEAKPLDENTTVEAMPTVIVDAATVEVDQGLKIASDADIEPVVESLAADSSDNNDAKEPGVEIINKDENIINIEKESEQRAPASEDTLKTIPQPAGESYRPQTFQSGAVTNPAAPTPTRNRVIQRDRTKVRFNIK